MGCVFVSSLSGDDIYIIVVFIVTQRSLIEECKRKTGIGGMDVHAASIRADGHLAHNSSRLDRVGLSKMELEFLRAIPLWQILFW